MFTLVLTFWWYDMTLMQILAIYPVFFFSNYWRIHQSPLKTFFVLLTPFGLVLCNLQCFFMLCMCCQIGFFILFCFFPHFLVFSYIAVHWALLALVVSKHNLKLRIIKFIGKLFSLKCVTDIIFYIFWLSKQCLLGKLDKQQYSFCDRKQVQGL